MKPTNLSLYFLVILVATIVLFKSRASYGYAIPETPSYISANDWAAIRPQLSVIKGGASAPNDINITPIIAVPPSATPALAGLAASASSIAGLAYYQRTGKDPIVALSDGLANAASEIFLPAYQAFRDNLVTPETFPDVAPVYIGEPALIGINLKDMADAAMAAASGICDNIKNIVNNHRISGIDYTSLNNTYGQCPVAYSTLCTGGKVPKFSLVSAYPYGGFSADSHSSALTWYNGLPHGYVNFGYSFVYYTSLFQADCSTGTGSGTCWWTKKYTYNVSYVVGIPTTWPPDSYDYPQMLVDLAASPNKAAIPNELNNILSTAPQGQIGVTANPAPATPAQAYAQPAINQQQVQNFYNNNYQNVANTSVNNITNNSTANEIATYNSAVTAAGAAAQTQNAQTPQKIDFPDISASGSANLPESPQYDTNIEQPQEQNFVNKVHAFLGSSLPVLSSIKSSTLHASGSPSMSTTIWGHQIDIDFSGQQTPLRAAGVVLSFVTLVVAYMIIVRS